MKLLTVLICFILLILASLAVFAAAQLTVIPTTVNAGNPITIYLNPDAAGVYKYAYIYRDNVYKAYAVFPCSSFKCNLSTNATFKIPANWVNSDKYNVRVYDYSTKKYTTAYFSVIGGAEPRNTTVALNPTIVNVGGALNINVVPGNDGVYRYAYVYDSANKYKGLVDLKCTTPCYDKIAVSYTIPSTFAVGKYALAVYDYTTYKWVRNSFEVTNISCTDSDGGKNYYLKGVVNWLNYTDYDSCIDSKNLFELFCVSNVRDGEAYSCPYGCKDGACINQTDFCTDSNGGFNPFIQGTVKGIYYGAPFNVTDFCTSSSTLSEYSCVENKPLGTDFNCVYNNSICLNGACVQQTTLGLENYPNMFIKDGIFNGVVVVGDFAPAIHVIAAVDIISSLHPLTKDGKIPAKLASEICTAPSTCNLNQNIISVGSACANAVTAKIKGTPADCKVGLVPGEGAIRLFSNYGYTHIVVEGYSDQDTKAASNVLADYKNYKLSGNEFIVKTPSTVCRDTDGGKNFYVKGTASGIYGSGTDFCFDSDYDGQVDDVQEYYCDGNASASTVYFCPNGCKEGACVQNISTIQEDVKCVFQGSNTEQKCYTATDSTSPYYGLGCSSSTETCVVDVKGTKGDQITWKSSCGGYAYTTMDGNNEYAYFKCGTAQNCTDSDGGKNIFVLGTASGPEWSTGKYVSQKDFCITQGNKSGRLAEFYCAENGQVASVTYGPEDGCSKCDNGVCVNQTTLKPDLIISDVTFTPSNPKKYDVVLIKITTKNIGTATANSPVVDFNRYNQEGTQISHSVSIIPSLAPDKSYTEGHYTKMLMAGTFTTIALADPSNIIPELNENNNILIKNLTVLDTNLTDFCTDSDGGFDVFVKGTVKGIFYGAPFNVTDFCTSNSALSEYSCVENKPLGTDFNCASLSNATVISACINGACVKAAGGGGGGGSGGGAISSTNASTGMAVAISGFLAKFFRGKSR